MPLVLSSRRTTGTPSLLGELRLDAMPKGGPLGGGHETLEAELVIAKLQRFAALGDILLLGGQVRHSLYRLRNSLRLALLGTRVERLAILPDIEKYHACELEILAAQTRVNCPCALFALLRLCLADYFTTRLGHDEFLGRETTCCCRLFLVKHECTRRHPFMYAENFLDQMSISAFPSVLMFVNLIYIVVL